MARCREHLVDCRAEDMEIEHVSTLVSDAWRVVYEGSLVWSSETGTNGLVVCASKPSKKGLLVWLQNQDTFGGFGLKTIIDRFDRLRPQNRRVADRRTRGGISELASR